MSYLTAAVAAEISTQKNAKNAVRIADSSEHLRIDHRQRRFSHLR
jgi:hypothetical protein